MNNIYILNKNYSKIGTLSNQGANPQAPYYEDLFVQELETGADTYQFSTMSTPYTQDLLEIGNHIMFTYKNRNELFTITSLEYSHNEGYKTIGVYAEGIGFDLLEVYMKRPENEKESSSDGGRDEDNDGDTSTDDEYADLDDMYLDENGIIVYDKDGSGPPSEEDMYVDENGIIVYRRNKYNRKKDSLEFKNISYPRFLSILLKNTGWSYVCQPGLESVKHDITVRYDTNIFAVLQDSMQSYRGVELEFVHELVGGRVQKVIKAYKDGGRGSFVGKRFEYGTNVRGITKTQEVANSEDDTILYVDNVGINVQYDVDFALKSAEVPEIEIGDTHYVIDRDFYPPMTIKARIGKIEVSFSDPTVNKIYLANNKRISGSAIEDEFGADDVADMLDDYEFEDDGATYDHYHDRLICQNEMEINKEEGVGNVIQVIQRWQTSVELNNRKLLPEESDRYYLGDEDARWRLAYTTAIDNSDAITSPRYYGYNYQVYYDREDMEDVVKITNSSEVTKQDLLNFVMNDLNVYEYSATEVNEVVNKDVDDPDAYFPNQVYFGLLSEDVVDHGDSCKTSTVGKRIGRGSVKRDTNNDGDKNNDDSHNAHTYNIPALLSCLIGAFQQHVLTGGGATTTGPSIRDEDYGYDGGSNPGSSEEEGGSGSGSNPGTGGGNYSKIICEELEVSGADGSAGIANIYGELYVTEKIKCSLLLEANDVTVDTITFPDGTVLTSASDAGASVAYITDVSINSNNHLIITLSNGSTIDAGALPTGSGDGSTPSGSTFDTITVRKIQGPDPGEGQYNRVEFADGISVGHIWSTNGNFIQMEDELVLNNGLELYGDLSVEDGNISANEVHALKVVFPDGTSMTSANGSGGGNSSTDNITASKITIGTPTDSKASRCSLAVKGNALIEGTLYIEGSYTVNGTSYSDKSLKENIRYIDAPITHSNDNLEKADLYDFIVNQVNICEYNFIDDDRDKIGFIANEYEGTKVGDKIIFRNEETDLLGYDPNNLLFATIGALQEEIRTRDEKIASLEARLARLEAMLDINND